MGGNDLHCRLLTPLSCDDEMCVSDQIQGDCCCRPPRQSVESSSASIPSIVLRAMVNFSNIALYLLNVARQKTSTSVS
eukprot:3557951-Amphidinium_carterae.1